METQAMGSPSLFPQINISPDRPALETPPGITMDEHR